MIYKTDYTLSGNAYTGNYRFIVYNTMAKKMSAFINKFGFVLCCFGVIM